MSKRLGEESFAFWSGTAGYLLAIAWERTIDLWDVAHLRRAWTIALDAPFRPDNLVFSRDGTTLTVVEGRNQRPEIRLWRVRHGALLRRFNTGRNANVNHMVFSPDGKVLATIGGTGPPSFLDSVTGKEMNTLPEVSTAAAAKRPLV